MGALSPLHLVFILVIVLIVMGPRRLTEMGAALGRTVNEFRHALDSEERVPAQPAPTPPASENPATSEPREPGPTAFQP
jgi:sec-independent protein translocase protein TatA